MTYVKHQSIDSRKNKAEEAFNDIGAASIRLAIVCSLRYLFSRDASTSINYYPNIVATIR